MSVIKEHLSPLITSLTDDELAKRFDYLVFSVDLTLLQSRNATKSINKIVSTAEALSKLGTIPQVAAQKHVIEKDQTDEFWQSATIIDLEEVRIALRELLKFLERESQKLYYTDFKDEIVSWTENFASYDVNNLKNYKKKVKFYLNAHRDEIAIYKLRHNKALTKG